MHLTYKSKAMPINIENYIKNSFTYDKWIISDEYTKTDIEYEYRIIVTSLYDVHNQNELSLLTIETSSFVDKLTMLLKEAIGISLNSPHSQITYRCIRGINLREKPKGWKSNFDELDSHLKETLDSYVTLTFIPNHVNMLNSALEELQIALNNYEDLDEIIKDLMALHNSAVEADELSCFLIFSKVIDMINFLYPYDKSNRKKDKRIIKYFPKLLPFFGETSIKDLMIIANSRKETRHYNKNSNQPLTGIEAELYYQRIDVLALEIIRNKLKLPPFTYSTNIKL